MVGWLQAKRVSFEIKVVVTCSVMLWLVKVGVVSL